MAADVALVPGASTMLMSCNHSIWWDKEGHIAEFSRCTGRRLWLCRRMVTCVVVGVTPSRSRRWPSSSVDESRFARVELADHHEQSSALIEFEVSRGSAVRTAPSASGGIQAGKRMAQRHQLAADQLAGSVRHLRSESDTAPRHFLFRRPFLWSVGFTIYWLRRLGSAPGYAPEPSPSAAGCSGRSRSPAGPDFQQPPVVDGASGDETRSSGPDRHLVKIEIAEPVQDDAVGGRAGPPPPAACVPARRPRYRPPHH